MHDLIEELSSSEAKTVLLNILYQIQAFHNSENSHEETMTELFHLYDEILNGLQNSKHVDRAYETVHIVCGESPAGLLRSALGRGNKVIGFPDTFAVGPLRELHKDSGRNERYEWLRDHLNMEMDYIEEEYEKRIINTIAEIEAIPENVPIVIWAAANADEQTGARYILHLIQHKEYDIFLINATPVYSEFAAESESHFNLKHLGEGEPEVFKRIYENKPLTPLSNEKKNQLQKEWNHLLNTDEVVRIWNNGKIEGVKEDHYDSFLITIVQNLHTEYGITVFIKAGRIIGEAIFQTDQIISDTFLEYRLRCLVYNGTFAIKGIPKSLRHYSVKLKL